ncbi:indole-3-acetic acid-amido synthetase GH3.10-like [Cornus florida]|uniref:indole-3-acetic acid-amido synthetase GH3.10-like n=1 Tax=Cornus florida TaxID=4283 RepID=UPI00289BAFA2|nr:indole-3-acetic acid-amido synthetase GH3.10-like [Cornus florida]
MAILQDLEVKFIFIFISFTEIVLKFFSLDVDGRRVYLIREGGRILEFIYSSKQLKTKEGLIAGRPGTATTHYFASEEFKIKQEKPKSFTCSPEEVISSGDYKQSTYCYLLHGLFFSDQVEFITLTFAYSTVQAFRSFDELWKDICNDIKECTLTPKFILPKISKVVLDIITPNPCLASRIQDCCEELKDLDWFGLIPKLWPNVKYVYSIMTRSMQPYLKKYGSTESWIGVNVNPSLSENVTFVVVPTFSYFEFIPLQEYYLNSPTDDYLEDEPLPLSQVKIGQEYEIVPTTLTSVLN